MRATDPGTYLRVLFSIIPKDIALSIEQQQPAGLDGEQWEQVTRIAAVVREIAPTASPDEIEQVLRSGFARQIGTIRSGLVANPVAGESKRNDFK